MFHISFSVFPTSPTDVACHPHVVVLMFNDSDNRRYKNMASLRAKCRRNVVLDCLHLISHLLSYRNRFVWLRPRSVECLHNQLQYTREKTLLYSLHLISRSIAHIQATTLVIYPYHRPIMPQGNHSYSHNNQHSSPSGGGFAPRSGGRASGGSDRISSYASKTDTAERFFVTGQSGGRSGESMAREMAAWDRRWANASRQR
ncbi:hypothetical protein F4779DRAFT_200153 [Xylariaceae sp. FL0662B]|nr:hypothetical protein F4779DRAFT_200153 [Xylariaceae sp. FL0662B]